MSGFRNKVALAALILVWTYRSFCAETENLIPAANTQVNAQTPDPKAKPLENDLSVGKSPSENLIFKPNLEYEQRQNAEAIKKLEKVRELHGTSNQWNQVATLLREVLTSDTSQDIKNDVKQTTLLELSVFAEERGWLEQSQQYLAEFVQLFPKHTMIPEVLLRQAFLYQKMGALERAIHKLYDVLKSAVTLSSVNLPYSQRVTLTAQNEIAETLYAQGAYEDAAKKYEQLLKNGSEELNTVVIKTKLVRSLVKAGKIKEAVSEAVDFLNQHPDAEQQAEIRYLLASAYRAMGQQQESLRQFLLLLEAVEVSNNSKWKTWKMLAGNEIGNQLFMENQWADAITVYQGLLGLDEAPSWKLPLSYQVGLCFEHALQPDEAIRKYQDIIVLSQKTTSKLEPSLQMVVDMARFRNDILSWKRTLDKPALPTDSKAAPKTQ